MTAGMYLVTKTYPQYGTLLVNGVTAVLINSASSADAKLNAIAACNQAFQYTEGESEANNIPQDAFGPDYFNSNDVVVPAGTPPGSGNLFVDGDAYIFAGPATAPIFVPGSSYSVTG